MEQDISKQCKATIYNVNLKLIPTCEVKHDDYKEKQKDDPHNEHAVFFKY
jgi:hypothetical protein